MPIGRPVWGPGLPDHSTTPASVCICSLRQRLEGADPVGCIQDAFFSLLKRWFAERNQYPYFYNVNWGNWGQGTRDPEEIDRAKWVFLFSSNEFTYHDTGVVNPLFLKSMNEKIAKALPAFADKRVVLFTMDAQDTKKLIREQVLNGVRLKSFDVISEADFPLTVQSVRYNLIRAMFRTNLYYSHPYKTRDIAFAYWGTTKRKLPGGADSKDARYGILRSIFNDTNVDYFLAGNHFGAAKADQKFDTDLRVLTPKLLRARATCCFQWPGFGRTLTARYHEAMGFGIIPLVHKDYDTTNILVGQNQWQRIQTAGELWYRIKDMNDEVTWRTNWRLIERWYLQVVPTDDEQYQRLKEILTRLGV